MRSAFPPEITHEVGLSSYLSALTEHVMISVTDYDGTTLFANERFCEISQYYPEELIGKPQRIFNLNRQTEKGHPNLWPTIAQGNVWRGTLCDQRKDGSLFWTDTTIVPEMDQHGQPQRFVTVSSDVTAHMLAKESLVSNRNRLQAVLSSLPVLLFTLDEQGRFILIEGSAVNAFAVSAESLLGCDIRQVFSADNDLSAAVSSALAGLSCRIELTWNDAVFATHLGPLRIGEQGVPGVIGVSINITSRKQAENLLQAAKEEAEQANRAKSEFLSRMSHELRSPLNAVLGFAQLLQYDDETPLSTDQRECVEHIVKGGNHLLQLINEVLDLAAIEVGKLPVQIDDQPLHLLVSDCLVIASPLAKHQGIRLINEISNDSSLWIRGDALRLKQVLINLLSNAIKYNIPQGKVRIYATQPDIGRIRLHVADTGPGLDSGKLSELFQPFNRLGLEFGHVEGSGIGLVITKSLIELMDGNMGVDSQVGLGSTFWFELNASSAQSQMALNAPKAVDFPSKASKPALSGSILYVEDCPISRELVAAVCQQHNGIQLRYAADAGEALHLAEQYKPDLILMDAQLPGISGMETYRALQENPVTRAIPVVIVSADAMPDSIKNALDVGIQAYLTKPVDLPALVQIISQYLSPLC